MEDYVSRLVPTEKSKLKCGKNNKDKVYFPGYVMIEANLVGEYLILSSQ
jgi:transcriptional antiterminator NusG